MNLKIKLLVQCVACLLSLSVFAQDGWDMVKKIEANINPPLFRNRNYNITDFGLSKQDARPAINKAITTCSKQGGGRVIVPAGNYFIKGPINLKSHVNLHLEKGAELVFSSNENDYLPVVFTRWEGTEVYNYSPLIYARNASDIAITGQGVLNGKGSANFVSWKAKQQKDQQALREMGRQGVPVEKRVFGKGHYLRPAFVEFVNCKNILIENITLTDATFWVMHPIYCNNVTVRGVTVDSRNFNSDGCDPESSTNVLIENCHFVTGDDGIAIKSGRDNDGWKVGKPTENVIIRNCSFTSETNGVCVGSEISGGVRNVFIENVQVPKAGNAIYFKSNLDRGGFIEQIRIRNVTADSLKTALVKVEPDYKSEKSQHYPTRFNDYVIENISANYVRDYGVDIRGFKDLPVSDITIRKLTVKKATQLVRLENAERIHVIESTINGIPVTADLPNKSVSLNGIWNVSISETKPEKYVSKVAVPGVITMAKPKLAEDLDGIDHKSIPYNYVWYQHEFTLHENAFPQAILKLRAKYNAAVWLNGVEIGYDAYTTYSHGSFDISKALNLNGKNELVIRVGSWNTSTAPSKENSAEWWRNSRAPGIWDDVRIELGQEITTGHVKILPDTKKQITSCEMEVKNHSKADKEFSVITSLLDDGKLLGKSEQKVSLKSGEEGIYKAELRSGMLKYWSAGKEGNPKLYQVNVKLVTREGKVLSDKSFPFGYRSIEVNGKDVLVNGKKIFFRAENVAFVRSLNRWSEAVFNEKWIRNFLRTAIHDYGFNYLRIHLGHAYNKWYDIADEEGIMLQDEWRYMHDDEPTGKEKDDAVIEFTRWVRENVNHPSIVVWDQENEGNVRLLDLIKQLRQYDPSRLWEEDYYGVHNYQYSENIVSKPDYILSETKPSTVLESCRLWENENGLLEPRENFKTSRTSSGWGMYYYTPQLIEQLQADIHADLGTHVRDIRMQAWAPFALLSGWVNGQNFFKGNIADSLVAKPNLLVLKRLNEPIGASVNMLQAREWYKDKVTYKPDASFTKDIVAWNDFAEDVKVTLVLTVKDLKGKIVSSNKAEITIPAYQSLHKNLSFITPKKNGVFIIEPSLVFTNQKTVTGVARRIMVANMGNQSIRGLMGFGGIRKPFAGSHSIIEHFLGFDPSEKMQEAIIAAVGNGLLDKLVMEKGGKDCLVQSTTYLSSTRSLLTSIRLDGEGKVLSRKQSEALNYVDLPVPVKTIINEAIGTVPVDESKLSKSVSGNDTVYELTVIGSEDRYRLTFSPDGKLKQKEVFKKGEKNRISN